jgi:hypothetical protein
LEWIHYKHLVGKWSQIRLVWRKHYTIAFMSSNGFEIISRASSLSKEAAPLAAYPAMVTEPSIEAGAWKLERTRPSSGTEQGCTFQDLGLGDDKAASESVAT